MKRTGNRAKNSGRLNPKKPTPKGLVPFKPGTSGNPRGRPKKDFELVELIQTIAARRHPQGHIVSKQVYGEEREMTRLEVLLLKLEQKDPKTFLAYGWGKPIETMQHQGADGGPLQIGFYHDTKDVTGPDPVLKK